MALPPLPASNTERWWCVYINNSTTHRMGMRTIDGVINTQISPVFFDIFFRHQNALLNTQITGLERAVRGSDVRVPFPFTTTSNIGVGDQNANDRRARFLSYTGRSLDGRKVRLFVFGITDLAQGDYRVTAAESAIILSVTDLLNQAQDVLQTISGAKATWHAYANIGFHDHWIKEYRKG